MSHALRALRRLPFAFPDENNRLRLNPLQAFMLLATRSDASCPTMRIQLPRARGTFRERTTRRVAKVEIISPRLSLDSAIPITRAFRSQDAIRRTGKELSDVCLSRANQFALRLKLISAFGRRLSTRRCSRDEEFAPDELRRTLKSPLQRRVPMRAPVLSS